MLDFIARYRINEYSDVLGLAVTFIGFLVTIWQVIKSRRVASEALDVAKKVRVELSQFEIASEIAAAIAVMEETKRLHRKGDFDQLPDRYSFLRRSLISLRANASSFSESDLSIFQQAITQLAASEKQIDKYIAAEEKSKIDVPRMNGLMSAHIDSLHELFVRLRISIGD